MHSVLRITFLLICSLITHSFHLAFDPLEFMKRSLLMLGPNINRERFMNLL